MGLMAYSLLWVMQDFDHQPYVSCLDCPGSQLCRRHAPQKSHGRSLPSRARVYGFRGLRV